LGVANLQSVFQGLYPLQTARNITGDETVRSTSVFWAKDKVTRGVGRVGEKGVKSSAKMGDPSA
jgi:hypothetical protein